MGTAAPAAESSSLQPLPEPPPTPTGGVLIDPEIVEMTLRAPATARAPLTSLDHLQTKWQNIDGVHLIPADRPRFDFSIEPISLQESIFRHSGWAPRRSKIFSAMKRVHESINNTYRFCNCGASLFVEQSGDGQDFRLRSNTCGSRWCTPCMNERATVLRDNLAILCSGKLVRFVTLTLRHSPTSLKSQIDRLYRSFRELRRREFWKSNVTGGAAFLELKLSSKSGLWHPHLHMLVETKWLEQRELSRSWHEVTGDSTIVDVRPIGAGDDVQRYVTKYVTKPASAEVFAVPDKLDEMMVTLRGRRLCTTFGKWRGEKLEEREKDERPFKSIGRLETFITRARAGDDEAKFVLDRLRDKLRGESGVDPPWKDFL
jgi:hypothetical protein